MQEEEALRGAYIQRGPRGERKTNDICYHMLRILKVILEGHPCSMRGATYFNQNSQHRKVGPVNRVQQVQSVRSSQSRPSCIYTAFFIEIYLIRCVPRYNPLRTPTGISVL